MYLYLGQNTLVPKKSVVGVFDMDNATYSKITREALGLSEKRGEVINAAEDLPRSFIICVEGGRRRVYLSQLSSAAVARRMSALRGTSLNQ